MLVGPSVRTPSEQDDSRARHEAALPMVGLNVDLEYRRCGGREPTYIARPVSSLHPVLVVGVH